jgi:hypothetical protein
MPTYSGVAITLTRYGSLAGIASLCKQWTSNGEFTDEDCLDCLEDTPTNPTLTEVLHWQDQLSAIMNTALAGEGFTVPITNTTAVKSIDLIVEQLTADLVQAANQSGRFFTERAQQAGAVPMMVIRKEILTWANENAAGLAAAGATRGDTPGDSIGTKTNTAIFQRAAFGNTFQDWNTTTEDD